MHRLYVKDVPNRGNGGDSMIPPATDVDNDEVVATPVADAAPSRLVAAAGTATGSFVLDVIGFGSYCSSFTAVIAVVAVVLVGVNGLEA